MSPYKDPDRQRAYQREWIKRKRHKRQAYRKTKRLEVLKLLGGKCVYCGCDNIDALQINHKFGGGQRERANKPMNRFAFNLAILNGTRRTDDLELACAVCNAWHFLTNIKGLEDRWTIFYHKDGTPGQN